MPSVQLGKGTTISRRWSNSIPRGIIHNRVSIEKRPKIVQKRSSPGDIEVDFIMGMNHKGALVVITDRATLHTSRKRLEHKQINEVSNAIISKLKKAVYPLQTMTLDND